MNPFVPTPLDGALTGVSVGALMLALAALTSLLLSRAAPDGRSFAWAFVILFVPIVGSAMWFVTLHRERSVARLGVTPLPARRDDRTATAPPGRSASRLNR